MSNLTAHAKALREIRERHHARRKKHWITDDDAGSMLVDCTILLDHIDNVQPLYEAVVEAAKRLEHYNIDGKFASTSMQHVDNLEKALAALREYKEKQGE